MNMQASPQRAATLPAPPLWARRPFGTAAVFILGYVLLDWATYVYPIRPFAITLWNPTAGVALAVLLVCGVRVWPVLALAVLLADVVVRGVPPNPLLEPFAAGVLTLGYAAMAALLRGPLNFGSELAHFRDVATLLVVAALGALVTAVAYVDVYSLGGLVQPYDFQRAVMRCWIGNLIGIVTTTPLLLLQVNWRDHAAHLRRRGLIEFAAQLCAVILALWVIFGLKWASEYRLFYLLFLPLIWLVMQHGIVGAAVGIAMIELGMMMAVEYWHYRSAAVLEFQILMLALATAGLIHGVFVSERRVTREALNRSESRLRVIVSTAPDAIISVDARGGIVAANPAAARFFGCAADQLIGASVYRLLPDFDRVAQLGEVAEVQAFRCDGSCFAAELAVGSAGDASAPDVLIGIVRDITRRKEIELELAEKQAAIGRSARLAAAGEMAAALAHELHQPLSAIRTYARASQISTQVEQSNALMQKIEREAARAGEVVQRLRNFFRGGASQFERIKVADLIEGALEPMRADAERDSVALDTDIADGAVELLVDRVQIETVLHCLVGNAIEAIAQAAADKRCVRVATGAADHGWIRVAVVDSGPGVSAKLVARLFEPFATTKPTGIGLGLAMSRSIVEAHGGRLTAQAGGQGGMIFSFSLPTAALKEDASESG